MRVARQRDAIRVGHRDQAEFGAQAFERRDRVGEGLPAQHGELKGIAGRIVRRKAKLLGEVAVDIEHHFARSLRMRIAAALVGGENLLVAEHRGAAAGNPADGVEHAGLEVDQCADDIERQNLEIAERAKERNKRF